MQTIIIGFIGMALITWFTLGLAISIGEWPFKIIVGLVLILAYIDYIQSVREDFEAEKRDPVRKDPIHSGGHDHG